jgi:tRNA modification GTPase
MSFEKTSVPHPDDTIVVVSSAPGPGLRAIVRVSGPNTRGVIDAVFRRNAEPGGAERVRTLVPGAVRLSGVHSPLPADLYVFPGPHSYTGQDLAELHTIGSPPLVERLVADLLAAGARPARPGEFTLRAFLAGKKDLPQAEAVHAVVEAGTDADLKQALAQLAGGVTQPLHALREDLLNLLADLEAALDFADEDVEFVGKPETLVRIASALARLANLQRQLDSRTVSGRAVRVALVGLPNAGKSSLFNALAGGPAALVSPEAGTTRDYLTRRLDLGGVPVELIDTAGWQDAADTIAEQAQRLGREQATRADVILWCAEPGTDFDPADAARLAATGAEALRVRTKADLANRISDDASAPIPTSVIAPSGTDALRAALTERVASLARPPLAPSQSRCRHHVEACVRSLREAHRHVLFDDPPEIVAVALRSALGQLGEMTGAVYTNDLLDRIFSRFCIGK